MASVKAINEMVNMYDDLKIKNLELENELIKQKQLVEIWKERYLAENEKLIGLRG